MKDESFASAVFEGPEHLKISSARGRFSVSCL
jgi:hypothetical protein